MKFAVRSVVCKVFLAALVVAALSTTSEAANVKPQAGPNGNQRPVPAARPQAGQNGNQQPVAIPKQPAGPNGNRQEVLAQPPTGSNAAGTSGTPAETPKNEGNMFSRMGTGLWNAFTGRGADSSVITDKDDDQKAAADGTPGQGGSPSGKPKDSVEPKQGANSGDEKPASRPASPAPGNAKKPEERTTVTISKAEEGFKIFQESISKTYKYFSYLNQATSNGKTIHDFLNVVNQLRASEWDGLEYSERIFLKVIFKILTEEPEGPTTIARIAKIIENEKQELEKITLTKEPAKIGGTVLKIDEEAEAIRLA